MISFMITTGSLNNEDMTRILKQWRHDFSGKNLRDRYGMDIIWCLCGGQNSCFCKASLRIYYVSLFECKGPWMLIIWGDLGINYKRIIKVFPILVFEGSLSVEIEL